MGLLDSAAKKAKESVFGGGSNNSNNNQSNNNNQTKSDGGGGGGNDGTKKTDKRIHCATCCIVIGFIIIFIAIILGLVAPAWLIGNTSGSGAGLDLKVGVSQIIVVSASVSKTSKLTSTECDKSSGGFKDACYGWKRAGAICKAILIITLICTIIATLFACCFCGGDGVFECIGGCIPCCAPGAGSPIPIPSFLPCAETAAAAGPRYLTLFASACCDIMMFILLLIAPIIYNLQTKDDREPALGLKLKTSTCYVFCFVGAVCALLMLCVHGVLIFVYPTLIMAEMAEEGAGVAGKGAMGAGKGAMGAVKSVL